MLLDFYMQSGSYKKGFLMLRINFKGKKEGGEAIPHLQE
jgi:hypothetical protein